jgi:hypothetical protein
MPYESDPGLRRVPHSFHSFSQFHIADVTLVGSGKSS